MTVAPLWHPPGFDPVPAPPLWGEGGALLLPDPVRLIALNQPYAGLLFGDAPGAPGPKALETRRWPWPYEPGWLAIFATRRPDRAAVRRIYGAAAAPGMLARLVDPTAGSVGVVLGVVWIGGCRPMCPEDEKAAFYPYEPGRFVWVIGASYRLARRLPLSRGPQKFASVPRTQLKAAFFAPAGGA